MDTLYAFSVAVIITLFFVSRYMKRIGGSAPVVDAPAPAKTCPRCGTQVAGAFCSACGAPMSIWNFGSPASAETTTAIGMPVINASLCIGCGACVDACPEAGTLALVAGKAILANPDRCKSHGDCVTACPTSGIILMTGSVRQTIRVPAISANYETNIPGLFITGELSGVGLIKTAINDGHMVAEHLRAALAQSRGLISIDAANRVQDVIVVGAGPAGLSTALSLHEHGVRYVVLEQGEIASTIRHYPRNKFLMEEPLEMPLYGKLYIKDTTKEALLEVWERMVEATGVRIRTNEKVEAINRKAATKTFLVRTSAGEYEARFVVLAIGKRGTPRKLGVPGEDLSKVVYRLIEAETYSDSDVAVIGGGDSAIEAALALSKDGRNRVTLVHRGPDFSKLRERNRVKLIEAESSGAIKVLRNARVQSVRPESLVVDGAGGPREIANHWLFVMIGGESPEAFLAKIGVDIVERVIAA